MPRTSLLAAGALIACVLAVGAMGRTDLEVEAAEDALARARRAAQMESGFFLEKPLLCRERLHFLGIEYRNSGFMTGQSDTEYTTSECLYQKVHQPETQL